MAWVAEIWLCTKSVEGCITVAKAWQSISACIYRSTICLDTWQAKHGKKRRDVRRYAAASGSGLGVFAIRSMCLRSAVRASEVDASSLPGQAPHLLSSAKPSRHCRQAECRAEARADPS